MQGRPCGYMPDGVRIVSDPDTEPRPEGWTRFACFSDTHGQHSGIPAAHLPEADVLLHAGDFTDRGELQQVESFSEWLRAYPAAHKVVIAGNHDVTFHEEHYRHRWRQYHGRTPYDCRQVREALSGCTYLEDASLELPGCQIYGSPWVPQHCNMAFNLPQGRPLRRVWEKVPAAPDVLLTHTPPWGICDTVCTSGRRAGCRELLKAICKRAVPVSVFGHIHEGYGVRSDGATLFVNASTCTRGQRPTNAPVVFDLAPPEERRAAAAADCAAALGEDGPGPLLFSGACASAKACLVCDGSGVLLQDVCPLCDGLGSSD